MTPEPTIIAFAPRKTNPVQALRLLSVAGHYRVEIPDLRSRGGRQETTSRKYTDIARAFDELMAQAYKYQGREFGDVVIQPRTAEQAAFLASATTKDRLKDYSWAVRSAEMPAVPGEPGPENDAYRQIHKPAGPGLVYRDPTTGVLHRADGRPALSISASDDDREGNSSAYSLEIWCENGRATRREEHSEVSDYEGHIERHTIHVNGVLRYKRDTDSHYSAETLYDREGNVIRTRDSDSRDCMDGHPEPVRRAFGCVDLGHPDYAGIDLRTRVHVERLELLNEGPDHYKNSLSARVIGVEETTSERVEVSILSDKGGRVIADLLKGIPDGSPIELCVSDHDIESNSQGGFSLWMREESIESDAVQVADLRPGPERDFIVKPNMKAVDLPPDPAGRPRMRIGIEGGASLYLCGSEQVRDAKLCLASGKTFGVSGRAVTIVSRGTPIAAVMATQINERSLEAALYKSSAAETKAAAAAPVGRGSQMTR